MTGSVIEASIDPGLDGVFGNPTAYIGGDDTALPGGGSIGKISLYSTAFTGKTIGTMNTIAHNHAILGKTINGVYQLTSPPIITADTLNAGPNISRDLRVGGPLTGDLLFFTF